MREMKDSGVEWIGEIPQNWTCLKLKHVIESCDGGVWGKDPTNTTLDKIVIRSTEQSVDGKWYISNPATRDLSGIKNLQRFRIQVGDLLMTKSSGSALHIGKTTLAGEYFVENECYYSNFLQRIRLIINPQFAWYILNSSISREQFVYLQNSTSGIGNINAENISNIYIPVPNRDAQKMISDFLNAKCIKTDTLIQNVQTQIEKLKAYKQSLITEVVTKGLDSTVPMKNSGVDWIGHVPNAWEVKPMLREIETVVDYRGKTPEKVDAGILLVTARNIKDGKIDYSISQEYVRSNEYEEIMHRGKLNIGDILFTTEAPLGAVANVDRTDFALAQRIIKFTTKSTLNPYYLKYWMLSLIFQQHLKSYATGSTASGIKASKLCLLKLVNPPRLEQDDIVSYLDKKCSQIDRLIAIKQAKIEKLEQYKRSLIYEYVTGKKEVI